MPEEKPRPHAPLRTVLAPAGPVRVPVEHAPDQHSLRTPRLTLRPLLEADRDEFTAALAESREHLDAYLPLHEPGWTDQDVFEHHLEWAIDGLATGSAVRRAVFDDLGVFLGCCNLLKIDRALELRAEISVWIRRTRARGGYAHEAMAAVIEDAFEDLPRGMGLHTIIGCARPDNTPSLRMIAKLGFLRTGDPPQQMSVAGAWKLHENHALTVDRWRFIRPEHPAEPAPRSARTA